MGHLIEYPFAERMHPAAIAIICTACLAGASFILGGIIYIMCQIWSRTRYRRRDINVGLSKKPLLGESTEDELDDRGSTDFDLLDNYPRAKSYLVDKPQTYERFSQRPAHQSEHIQQIFITESEAVSKIQALGISNGFALQAKITIFLESKKKGRIDGKIKDLVDFDMASSDSPAQMCFKINLNPSKKYKTETKWVPATDSPQVKFRMSNIPRKLMATEIMNIRLYGRTSTYKPKTCYGQVFLPLNEVCPEGRLFWNKVLLPYTKSTLKSTDFLSTKFIPPKTGSGKHLDETYYEGDEYKRPFFYESTLWAPEDYRATKEYDYTFGSVYSASMMSDDFLGDGFQEKSASMIDICVTDSGHSTGLPIAEHSKDDMNAIHTAKSTSSQFEEIQLNELHRSRSESHLPDGGVSRDFNRNYLTASFNSGKKGHFKRRRSLVTSNESLYQSFSDDNVFLGSTEELNSNAYFADDSL